MLKKIQKIQYNAKLCDLNNSKWKNWVLADRCYIYNARKLKFKSLNKILRLGYLNVWLHIFEDRIISRRADVVWPLRSCNLTPLNYYLWKWKWSHTIEKVFLLLLKWSLNAFSIKKINYLLNWIDNLLKTY